MTRHHFVTEQRLLELKRRHTAWLDKLGIRHRPWLIFGSAPNPTIADEFIELCARVDVNNSGRTAEMLGFGRADLTIRKRRKSWLEHPRLNTRGLVWFHTAPTAIMRLQLLLKPHVRVGTLQKLTKDERNAIMNEIVGPIPEGIGKIGKATNGVAAICYGLFLGAPSIVVSGMSVTKMGHSYNEVGKTRKQIDEDIYALTKLSAYPNLFTTEAELSEITGMTLIQNATELSAPR
ncbi:hypothetical protein [Rhizobium sullae]|uniref:Uncharacterized protein n=1 Tax=Rhizobium sullae TaxID=50338 RepID=A0A4R3Q2T5_RHISU|nr:hypothetical protein [Rhizobium sullae]TCU14637.1 hypothetical protein EV132_1083 [Rhizobium sullae]